MYYPPRDSATPTHHSQFAVIERLVASGVRAQAAAAAISLLRTGETSLIKDVLAGRLTVERALKIARQRGW
jgi:hypothetical protein